MNYSRPIAACYFLPSDFDSTGSSKLKAGAAMCRYKIGQVSQPE